ncbi:MAG TPA: sigma-70 family RNA polymerase sigma factor [Acidimicrobiales bacterium]|nr:sigma-70 family RNA polymerase sigma factor [Acidimicrobiales bacterium]
MDDFETFVRDHEPRLRRALTGARGALDGRDATAEALAYAWEHWDDVQRMTNPLGYLYRVGQSRTRSRKATPLAPAGVSEMPEGEPELVAALAGLTEPQRVSVFLVHGCGWRQSEVAEVLEITASTVSTHVQRGMARLREVLEVAHA